MPTRTLNEKPKVLYLSRGGDISGAQRQLLYLVKALDTDRFAPVVLCTEEGQFPRELQAIGIPCIVRPLAGWRKAKNLISRYRDAAYVSRLVKREGISLIHSSDIQFSEYMLRSAGRTNVPSVLHIRAPISRRTAENYRCSEATALVAISKRVQRRLSQMSLVPDDRIILIQDAVDQDLFVPSDNRANGNILRKQYEANDRVLVGLVGRVEPYKQQLDFVKIAKEVLDEAPNVIFLIVGEVRDLSYHAQIVQYLRDNDLLDHVHFTGRREDMPEVLGGLDILVSLSGGSVRYEAMMCGTAVVCAWSRTPEESYHIRHNETGLLVTEREILPVVGALLSLIHDADLRKRIGRHARQWAQQHLNHPTLVENTQSLYERLLRG